MKKIVTLLAVLAVATMAAIPSFAAPVKGTWGVGYHNPDFPLGARIWMSDKVALDLGLGIDNEFNAIADGNKTSWGLEFGVPIVLAGMNDDTQFFVRPGIDYRTVPNPIPAGPNADLNNTASFFGVSGQLGVEHWFGKRFSLQAAHGIRFENENPGVGGSHSAFVTEGLGISDVGFHYYFGGGN